MYSVRVSKQNVMMLENCIEENLSKGNEKLRKVTCFVYTAGAIESSTVVTLTQ